MSTLLFRVDINDHFRGKMSLFVRRNRDRSMSYQLLGGVSTPFALSNLQMRYPLPTWHAQGEPLGTLLDTITEAVNSGVYRVAEVEQTPLQETHCPDCDVMLLDDEQIYCHCCGRKL